MSSEPPEAMDIADITSSENVTEVKTKANFSCICGSAWSILKECPNHSCRHLGQPELRRGVFMPLENVKDWIEDSSIYSTDCSFLSESVKEVH